MTPTKQEMFERKLEVIGMLHELCGMLDGLRTALLVVLEARALPVTAETRARIGDSRWAPDLERWIDRAVTATTLEDVFP
jgi:hypothetical protein